MKMTMIRLFGPILLPAVIAISCFPLSAAPLAAVPGDGKTEHIVFPDDPSVVNAKRELGAKGDGVADDTAALQRGLDISCGLNARQTKVLYLPNGTYRVTQTLVVKNALGPWLYGETRDGVVIKLDDGAKECNAVLRTHPRETGSSSADWFMRNVRNLTIDAGNNPGTDGIRWHSTNTGILKNVRVKGNGKVGINSGFIEQGGPNLIQDCEIEGFETGIQSQWMWGQTLSRVKILNCRKQGVFASANVVAIEDLMVSNTPVAIVCDYPNDWYWWGGAITLIGARFSGGDPNSAAIKNKSVLYARDVQANGYKTMLQSTTPGGDFAGLALKEYLSHPAKKLFDDSGGALQLPIKNEPHVPWETAPEKWLCANDFGAIAGDNKDDTQAIQKALDEAARTGKTTVYFRGCGGDDPNGFTLDGEVFVRGSVRYILGLGWARILSGKNGKFVVDSSVNDSVNGADSPVVKFQNIDSFGGAPPVLENRSALRTMVVESCGVTIVGNGGGDIFATDCPAHVYLKKRGQKLWARHLNPEGNSDVGLLQNFGGDLWVLGMKCEGQGVRCLTADGGRTEISGAFMYSSLPKNDDTRPMFDVDKASLSVVGIREISFAHTYPVKVREKRGNETKTLSAGQEHGWIGWPLIGSWAPLR